MKNLKNNKTIIVIDGPDALGKTTQVLRLTNNLLTQGVRAIMRKQPHRNRKKIFDPSTKPTKVAQLTIEEYESISNAFMSSEHEVLILDRCAFSSIPCYNYQKMSFEEMVQTEKRMIVASRRVKMPDIFFIFQGQPFREKDDTVFEKEYDRGKIEKSYAGMIENSKYLKTTEVFQYSVIVPINASSPTVLDDILDRISEYNNE